MTSEVMTEAESLMRIDMLTRERDDTMERLAIASLYCWAWDEEDETVVAEFTQRPGYQNGLKKLEPLN